MSVLDQFSVPNRAAVVTGGNRGLGRAFAHALGEAGARVAIIARDPAANAAVVAELGAKGIGELPIDGPAPAILNAIENATGVAVDEIPLMPEMLMQALSNANLPRTEVTVG